MKYSSFIASALLATSFAAHAQKPMDGMPMSPPTAPTGQKAGALTEAVVQRVDNARGEIVLKHGDILNLGMPAMTMAFEADGKALQQVKAGDKVRFHAEIMKGKPTVTHIGRAP